MPDDYPLLDNQPVQVRSPNAETWHLLGDLQEAFPSGWVLIGELIDDRGFWRFANDEQAARAALRILTAGG